MALDKQQVTVNFSKGLDTKSDPWQVPIGNFLELENSVFTKQGLLQKRNGFAQLGTVSGQNITGIDTLNDQLILFGDSCLAFENNGQSYNRGYYKPAKVEAQSIVRTVNATQSDSAVIGDYLCTVYSNLYAQVLPGPVDIYAFAYTITNRNTGQIIISPTELTATAGTVNGSPRVFALNSNFVIVYPTINGGTENLQYTRIPSSTLVATSPAVVSTSMSYNTRGNFDGVVYGNNLYLAWQSATSTKQILAAIMNSSFVIGSPVTISTGSIVSQNVAIAADSSNNNITISYYDSGATGGTGPNLYASIRNSALGSVLAQTTVVSAPSPGIVNVGIYAESGTTRFYYERPNTYSYGSNLPTNYISQVTMTTLGVIGTPSVFIRGNGLASKPFKVGSEWYVSTCHQSEFQDGYFVLNTSAKVVAKYAYENGDGYITRGLPSVNVNSNLCVTSYQYKTSTATSETGATETAGVNNLKLTIGDIPAFSAEINNTLSVSGGFLWSYDGRDINENNFFIYPENLYVVGDTTGLLTGGLVQNKTYFYNAIYSTLDNQGNLINSYVGAPVSYKVAPTGGTFTANAATGSNTLTNVSTFTNIQIGQTITGNGIATTAIITNLNTVAKTITMSVNSTGNFTAATYTVTKAVTAVNISCPTLRITNRTTGSLTTGRLILINFYRYSDDQQASYLLGGTPNDTTVDSVTVPDTQTDAAILASGQLLYTTGGVLPNISGPPSGAINIYDNRVWVVDTERSGYLWYSKLVIPGTSVEMSADQTYFVSPTVTAQGFGGAITSLCPMDDKLVIFKEDALYYINGVGPDATGANNGYSEPVFITGTVGCKYPNSIVIMPAGLMFQSDKGIWLLGRDTSTNYIGFSVEKFTESATTVQALTIPNTNEVRFTLDTGTTLMYDYFFNQWSSFTNVGGVAATLYEQLHTYIDASGNIYQEAPGTYVDNTTPVLMKFTTNWFALGGILGFQRAYFFFLLGKYYSPHNLNINLYYDFEEISTQTTVVNPNIYNGEYTSGASVERWRIMLQRQKCDSVKISINETYDPTLALPAGQGLTLSGINFIIGIKREFNTVPAVLTAG